MSLDIQNYIKDIFTVLPILQDYGNPWDIASKTESIIGDILKTLDDNYVIENGVAIHKTATVEQNVIFHGPCIVSENCFIAANCYIRGGVFFGKNVHVGPSCEIKSSFIFPNTAIAHLNYMGNSLVGSGVNMEGGSVIANHFNERINKEIKVKIDGNLLNTNVKKFGALVGDESRIGANAVTTPGTILPMWSIVGRLELVKQVT